jgi:hypothetical protein
MKRLDFYLLGGLLALNAVHAAAVEDRARQEIGDATQAWFAMQADGSAAGPAAPMSGAQASAAYTRYMKSFDKPIPDHFGSSVKENLGSGASGG